MSKTKSGATVIGAAAVITCCVGFLPGWEGTDYVAKRDRIGTGHPITWCHGQTNADRKDGEQVKVGQRFTKQECDAELAKSLPTYLDEIGPCVHVPVQIKVMAALLDGAYNAGSRRVCTSPMVAKINAGNIRAGCNAFDMWIVTSDHVIRPGLIDRRAGELHGDHRKSERALCLEGANDPKSEIYQFKFADEAAAPAPVVVKPRPHKPHPKPAAAPEPCAWWRKCT